jgi:putative acetyltransferase
MRYRAIQPQDQQALADGIWQVYEAFDCVGPGYGPQDPDMKDLFEFYNRPGSYYLVAEDSSSGEVIGGCGFAAFGPAEAKTCELRKLFLLDGTRGHGTGREILQRTLDQAQQMGYKQCYLETVERMQAACALYEKFGFKKLKEAMFGGGHHVCESQYLKVFALMLLCVTLWLPACTSEPFVPPTTEEMHSPELREELISMHLVNEQLREELIRIGLANLSLKDVYRQESLDRMHSSRLKEILAYNGWPGKDLVGTDGAEAAFHLAEHSHREPQFQRECLKLMGRGMERGQVDPAHYAELFDRVQVAAGALQRFGTQAHVVDGQLKFLPIEDPQRVDSRRAKMGLVPLSAYRRQLEQAYLIRSQP